MDENQNMIAVRLDDLRTILDAANIWSPTEEIRAALLRLQIAIGEGVEG